MDILSSFFDIYERNARMFPIVIVVTPAFISYFCLFPEMRDLLITFISSVIYVSFIYLLGKLSRNIGKRKEDMLVYKWGGMPTTRFLRHSDTTYDYHTKKRYHSVLKRKIPNLRLPTPEEEETNRSQADMIYESAIKWLRSRTRDNNKYRLLFRENISYGFVRNLWALKQWGLLINVFVLISTIVFLSRKYSSHLEAIPTEMYFSLIVDLVVIIFFFLFTEDAVHSKAKAYARTLLEVCEQLK